PMQRAGAADGRTNRAESGVPFERNRDRDAAARGPRGRNACADRLHAQDDAVLIKDNHIAIAGSIQSAVEAARARAGHTIKIEVEVDTPDQLLQALALPIDAVLLDNMDTETLRACVQTVAGRVVTEASGSISPERVAAVARTGVDLISSGWITHSAPAMDFGLDIA